MSEQTKEYEGWAILELMGHRRLIGYLQEVTIAGAAMLRIDVLTAEGQSTQYYGAQAVYAITPTTEETARRAATLSTVAPINRWELPAPPSRPAVADDGPSALDDALVEDRHWEDAEGDDDEGEEPRDFVAESMARVESRHNWSEADDGPDNSM